MNILKTITYILSKNTLLKTEHTIAGRGHGWPKTNVDYDEFWVDDEAMAYYYDKSRVEFFKEIISKIPGKPNKILDIGCGDGYLLSSIYHDKKIKQRNLFGVDFSESGLDNARKKLPNGNFIKSDVTKLPFADNTYDLVLIIETLEHIMDWKSVLNEAWRVLMDKGYLIVTVPDGRKDTWEGHTNFWTIKDFKKILSKYTNPMVTIIDENRTLFGILKKNVHKK